MQSSSSEKNLPETSEEKENTGGFASIRFSFSEKSGLFMTAVRKGTAARQTASRQRVIIPGRRQEATELFLSSSRFSALLSALIPGLLIVAFSYPHEHCEERLAVEGYQRIEIAPLPVHGLIRREQDKYSDRAEPESPPV